MAELRVIHYDDAPVEDFPDGAQYRTLISEKYGGAPVVAGIQTSPPGYATPTHSHPYVEIIFVLGGEAEAWSGPDVETWRLGPGGTVLFPANEHHGFRVIGEMPLKTYGLHLSPNRIVDIHNGS